MVMPKIVRSMPPGFSVLDKVCTVPGCFHIGRGPAMGFYCVKHFQRWKKYGDPLVLRPPHPPAKEPK